MMNRKKIVICLVLAAVVILGSVAAVYAWHITRVHYIRQELSMARGQLDVTVYDATGTVINGINTNETPNAQNIDYVNTTTTVVNNIGGALNYNSSHHMTFYAKVENTGTLNLDIYMQMLINGSSYYDNIASYIHSCVSDITSDVLTDIPSYAGANVTYGRTYCVSVPADKLCYTGENLFELENLKKLGTINANTNESGTGNVRYYRIELWDENMPISITGQHLDFAVLIYAKQEGQPVGETKSDKRFTATNETEFLNYLNQAIAGNTIVLNNDMTINQSIKIDKPVNILIDNCSVNIRGDLSYDFSYVGETILMMNGSGKLDIDGNFLIDIPSTDFTLVGNNPASTVNIGSDRLGGTFYVNAGLQPRNPDYGFHIKNVTVNSAERTILGIEYDLSDIKIGSQTNVIIEPNTVVGSITAENMTSNVYIHVYGTVVNGIDLRLMQENTPKVSAEYPLPSGAASNGLDQIYIYVYGGVEEGTASRRFLLPGWARSWKRAGVATTDNSNTRIYYDLKTGVEDASGFCNAVEYFDDTCIELTYYLHNTVIRLNNGTENFVFSGDNYANAYRIIIKEYEIPALPENSGVYGSTNFIIQQLLAKYFLSDEEDDSISDPLKDGNLSEALASIDYIEIIMLDGTGSSVRNELTFMDLSYLAGNTPNMGEGSVYSLSNIKCVNLTAAMTIEHSIPVSAMENGTLRRIILPSNLETIKARAFTGSKIAFISIPSSVTSIASGSLQVSADNGMNGYLFVSLESDIAPTGDIMNGFKNLSGKIDGKTIVFMKPTVNEAFHAKYTFLSGAEPADALRNTVADGVDKEWYYYTYETAEYACTENGLYYFTRPLVGGAEIALILKENYSDTSWTKLNTNDKIAVVFPDRINGELIVSMGDRAITHLGITEIQWPLDFSGTHYTKLGDELFKQKEKAGITFVKGVGLGAVSDIGDYTFYNAQIGTGTSASVTGIGFLPRNPEFEGMDNIGDYAFYKMKVGYNIRDDLRFASSNPIYGTLDLHFRIPEQNSPGNYAFKDATLIGITLNLENSYNINSSVFSKVSLYSCTVSLNNTYCVRALAFKDVCKNSLSNGSITYTYNTVLYATDVPFLETGSLATNWSRAYIGIKSPERRSNNIIAEGGYEWGKAVYYNNKQCYGGPFANISGNTTVIVNNLYIDGDLAANTGTKGLSSGATNGDSKVTYNVLEFTENNTDTVIPAECFRSENAAKDTITINELLLQRDQLTEIGNYAFYNAKINSHEPLDYPAMSIIGSNAFRGASMPNIPYLSLPDNCTVETYAFASAVISGIQYACIGDNCVMKTYVFNSANMSGTRTLSIGEGCSVFANAFKSTNLSAAETITVGRGSRIENNGFVSVNVGSADIILTGASYVGSFAFAEMTTDSVSPANIDATEIGVIGPGAFGSPRLGTVRIGLTADDDNYKYGGPMKYSSEDTTTGIFSRGTNNQSGRINELIIIGCIPLKSTQEALGAATASNTNTYLTIGALDVSQCVSLPTKPFGSNVTIENEILDLSHCEAIPSYFFSSVSFPRLTEIKLKDNGSYYDYIPAYAFSSARFTVMTEFITEEELVIGTGAFKSATMPVLTTFTISRNSILEASSFESVQLCTSASGYGSYTISDGCTVGLNAFKSAALCNTSDTSNPDRSGIRTLVIGNNCEFKSYCFDSCKMTMVRTLTIGDNCTLGIINASGVLESYDFKSADISYADSLTVGSGCLLGTYSFTSANISRAQTVVIGDNCTVGSRSFTSANLSKVQTLTVSEGSRINDFGFYSANVGAADIILTGVISVGSAAFAEMTTNSASPANIDAVGVGIIGAGAFGSAHIGTVKVGVTEDDPSYKFGGSLKVSFWSNTTGILSREQDGQTAVIDLLEIHGRVPSGSVSRAFGAWGGGAGHYNYITVNRVDLSSCTYLTPRPFGQYVTINNETFDLSALETVPQEFLNGIAGAPNLTDIIIPDGFTVGDSAFAGITCKSLETIQVGENCTFGTKVFQSIVAPKISSISFGAGFTGGSYLFNGMNITDSAYHMVILSGPYVLPNNAFSSVKSTAGIYLQINGAERIADATCFQGAEGIWEIEFDGAMRDIYGGNVFKDCKNLKSIIFQRYQPGTDYPVTVYSSGSLSSLPTSLKFYVSNASYDRYVNDPKWVPHQARFEFYGNVIDNWTYIILSENGPDGYNIALESYKGGAALTDNVLTVPATLEQDGITYTVCQLRGSLLESGICQHVEELVIPKTVIYIEPSLFDSRSVTLAINKITVSDQNQFYRTDGVSSGGMNTGIRLESKDGHTLYKVLCNPLNTSGSTSITLDYQYIYAGALNGCNVLEEVRLGSQLTAVPQGLFTYTGSKIRIWHFSSYNPPALLGERVFGDIIYTKITQEDDGSGNVTYKQEYVGLDGYHIYVPSYPAYAIYSYRDMDTGFSWYAPIISAEP